jgi:hypothetical protein
MCTEFFYTTSAAASAQHCCSCAAVLCCDCSGWYVLLRYSLHMWHTLCSRCSTGCCRAAVDPAGNINTQPTDWFADVLWAGKDCYLGEASVHY